MKKHFTAALCCALSIVGESSLADEAAPSAGIILLNRLVQENIVGNEASRLSVDSFPVPAAPRGPMPRSATPMSSSEHAPEPASDTPAQQAIVAAEIDGAQLTRLAEQLARSEETISDLNGKLADAWHENAALEQQLAALAASGGDKQASAALTEELRKAGAEVASLKKQLADLQAQKKPPAQSGAAPVAQPVVINDATAKDVRASYAVGAWYGESAPQETAKFSSIGRTLDLRAFSQGFQDKVGNRMQLSQEKIDAELASVTQQLDTAMLSVNQKQGKAIIEKAAKEKGAVRMADGAVYRILDSGKAPLATPQSEVVFTLDEELGTGEVLAKGEKGNGVVKDLPPLFQAVLKKLGVGGSAKMHVPGEQIYGEGGVPGVVPPGAISIMTIRLVSIK